MLKTFLLALLVACCAPSWGALPFGSAHALVVDEGTGEVLLEKDSATAVPIASLTKLMTAMVVLDAQQDPNELIRIHERDVDRLKHTRSGVPVGAYFSRQSLLELALMSSDNHAAAALARTYPGGLEEFIAAMRQKIQDLDLHNTSLEEPTGLSPNNRASAADLVKVLRAASTYMDIIQFTTQSRNMVDVESRQREYRNTNGLVGAPGWDIFLSKTGYTNEAGRCLAMRIQVASRIVFVVLLGASAKSQRTLDALNVQRWLAGKEPLLAKLTRAVLRPRLIKVRAARELRKRWNNGASRFSNPA
jgi:D-alanyl-D-alanine carboxypeptidase/D-alanyl-D-alanine endopeptidase (penicillin-binding protein 7)